MKTWNDVRHFKPTEYDSPDAPGSGYNMDLDFVLLVDELRDRLGIPLVINSGYRTHRHNADPDVGGVECSAHTLGFAADIRVIDSHTRFRLLEEALKLGFRRIGISRTFIHLDVDPTKPKEVAWLY